jgi:hypothetical protein
MVKSAKFYTAEEKIVLDSPLARKNPIQAKKVRLLMPEKTPNQ